MQKTSLDMWTEIATKGVGALASQTTDQESIAMAEKYGTHNYKPMPVNIVRGEGARVWDGSGKEYIDCVGAYSAVAHGHLNPAIVKAIKEQMERVALTSRAFYTTEVALFLKGLAEYCEMDMVCPMNTGTEAVETCIKLARKWGYTIKGVEADKAEIIVCDDNFHGRSTTIVGFSSEKKYKEGFGPFAPGFKMIPFGDIDTLRNAITKNTVAFLCEPIQAEGGILIPSDGWMAEVRRLCDENNVLLIWDEVQTGFCRTGKKFAWMHEDAKPDLMAVGKPLGGGVLPVSAAVGKREVMDVFTPGDHGSTFGGNPLASAAALAALAEMETKDYAGRSASLGAVLKEGIEAISCSHVVDVRGKGLLIGIEVDEKVDSAKLAQAFVENGILTKETRSRTFRLAPPLVIDSGTVDEIIERTKAALLSVC